MSGKRRKRLAAELRGWELRTDNALTPAEWRALKERWARTPRPLRRAFDVYVEAREIRGALVRRVSAAAAREPGLLEAVAAKVPAALERVAQLAGLR
jgi:hypothetical protein